DCRRGPRRVAVVMAGFRRLRRVLAGYQGEAEIWATKSAEWSDFLDEYDGVLEVAADLFNVPVHRLPHGSRRHFRPAERVEIERLIEWRMADTDLDLPASLP